MDKTQNLNYFKDAILLLTILTLVLINYIPFDHMSENIPFLKKSFGHNPKCVKQEGKCNIFSGKWIPWPDGPYYTNETQCVRDARQNCMKSGRPDREFMKWRWQPDECQLDLFDRKQFLEIVRGKTMAFVGDSLSRNQQESLRCLLSSVTKHTNEKITNGGKFISWYYPDYNFTLASFSSVYLVKSDLVPVWSTDPMIIYLEEADKTWAAHIEKFDYVIFSSGHWFLKPVMYYKNGKLIGCNKCKQQNVTEVNQYLGYKMAWETTFNTILGLKHFKGRVFLRTISPSHFDPGKNIGLGSCPRTRPFQEGETEFNWLTIYYMFQKGVFRVAKEKWKKRGLKLDFLEITDAMLLRPDGHPSIYGPGKYDDCLHWCLPGPVDTWNEFLFHKLKGEI